MSMRVAVISADGRLLLGRELVASKTTFIRKIRKLGTVLLDKGDRPKE